MNYELGKRPNFPIIHYSLLLKRQINPILFSFVVYCRDCLHIGVAIGIVSYP